MYLSKVKLPRLVPLPVMATYLVFQLQHRVFTSSHLFCPVDSSASVLVSILFEKKTYKVRKKYICILDKEQLSGVCFTGLLFALFCPKFYGFFFFFLQLCLFSQSGAECYLKTGFGIAASSTGNNY